MNVQQGMRTLRKRLALTQTQLGQILGRELNSVQRYESTGPPTGSVLVQLAKIAIDNGHADLARVFQTALISDLGPDIREVILFVDGLDEPKPTDDLGTLISGLRNLHRRATATRSTDATSLVLRIIRPALEVYAGKEPKE